MSWNIFGNWLHGIINTSMGFLAGGAIGLVMGHIGLLYAVKNIPNWITTTLFFLLSLGFGAILFKGLGYGRVVKDEAQR